MKVEHLPHYTYEDYAKWQGDWELIEGIPYAMASPTRLHQRFVFRLQRLIVQTLEEKQCPCEVLSEVDWVLSEDTVLRPDISVLCDGGNEDYIRETPVLIVEVVLKASKKHDERTKFEIYQELGVPYYILLYPEEKILKAYRNTSEGYVPLENLRFSIKECLIELKEEEIWR